MAIIVGPNNTVQGKVPFKDLLDIEFSAAPKGESVAGSVKGLEQGVPSLFNPYALVVFPSAAGTAFSSGAASGSDLSNKIIDGGSADGVPGFGGNLFSPPAQKAVPTVSQLVNDQELNKKTPYFYTDFLYFHGQELFSHYSHAC
jgi:hypothetical protein